MTSKRSWRICLVSVCIATLGLGSARAIQVVGLAPDQVLQRGADGSAKARLNLRPLAGGVQEVLWRVTQASLALEDHDWTDAVARGDGQWLCELEALPTGGPYRIEFQARDSEGRPLEAAAIDGVLVGDLWVLAGQSNMEGVARLDGAEGPDALVHVFDMSDAWRIATEPLHERPLAVHPVYWNVLRSDGVKRLVGEKARQWRARRATGAGLGLPFAKELVRATGVPIGLIPCAYGGTSMDQWSPERKAEGSSSLYGAMLNRIASAGGRIKGIVWYQGESDANRQASAPYAGKMERFIAAVRADLSQSRLAFYYVQIGRYVTNGENSVEWDAIQEAQPALSVGSKALALSPRSIASWTI